MSPFNDQSQPSAHVRLKVYQNTTALRFQRLLMSVSNPT